METETYQAPDEESIENIIGKKGSTQVKLYTDKYFRRVESNANSFLTKYKERIKVRDVKFSEHPDPTGSGSYSYTSILIIYDVL